jgi:hypothetical protein
MEENGLVDVYKGSCRFVVVADVVVGWMLEYLPTNADTKAGEDNAKKIFR